MLRRTKLFDLQLINDNTFDATIASILSFDKEFNPDAESLPLLFTPNVDDVVKLNEKKYADLASVLRRSFYILPDGQPIIWVSRLFKGKKLSRRLPGSELFPLLWKEVIRTNKRVMVVAPSPEVGELLKKEYPALVYYVPPFFDVQQPEQLAQVQAEAAAIYDSILPELVFIGIRYPKQNHIALGLIDHHNRSYANPAQHEEHIGVRNYALHATAHQHPHALHLLMGASYEFYLGLKKRAPAFWQKIGMEWFYRFTQEPGRLFRRYFIDDMQFLPIVIREFFKRSV